jgi:hypothetical protein
MAWRRTIVASSVQPVELFEQVYGLFHLVVAVALWLRFLDWCGRLRRKPFLLLSGQSISPLNLGAVHPCTLPSELYAYQVNTLFVFIW